MLSDEELKDRFSDELAANYEQYFPTEALRAEGFERYRCDETDRHFWSTTDRDVCGEPELNDGFTFFSDNPAEVNADYIEVWERFEEFMEDNGYASIERYPVAARWRDDTEFVQASIYDFQPWVVNGRVDPPANPLVVPQFCLRFNDIDNVGVTMSHNTGFVMIGQHAFDEDWDQERYFQDLLHWFTNGLGIPKDELVLHEDAWAGGGNLGPCIEFFSRGLELANQVYMMYERDGDELQELDLKVLDMGMGHERLAWFVRGEETLYDATFGPVVEKCRERLGIEYDEDFLEAYLPHAALLNIDEVEDIDAAWSSVAKKLDVDETVLRDKLEPLPAMYSMIEHSRSLLLALADGSLPGNVKGGYNLRTIYRRAQGFIDHHDWDVTMYEVCEWHAEYLAPLFPELQESLPEVREILDAELEKYRSTKRENEQRIERVVEEGGITTEQLLELYDSHGIDPEDVQAAAADAGVSVDIPDNFYQLVSERHDQARKQHREQRDRVITQDVAATDILYFDSYDYVDFEAVVVAIQDKYLALNRTAFYPTGGGQHHDTGTLEGHTVVDVFKEGDVVVHEIAETPEFSEGDTVNGAVDWERRQQLAQHHTATHILGGVARNVLGDHIWQAGASKKEDKARLDITHYENLDDEQVAEIERAANDVVDKNLPVYTDFFSRDVAEQKYGFSIYQGGAVPGRSIRLVEIDDLDVQACGGTHVTTTGEVEQITVTKTSKVQDGVVRLEYVAGQAAVEMERQRRSIAEEAAELLDCDVDQVPGRADELFSKWKTGRKAVKKDRDVRPDELELESEERYDGDVVEATAEILRTQPEHVTKTITRFSNELDEFKEELA